MRNLGTDPEWEACILRRVVQIGAGKILGSCMFVEAVVGANARPRGLMVNKLVDMGRTRRTSVEDIADIIGCSIACTRELLGIFSVAGGLEEFEELKQRLEFGDRGGGEDDLVSRTERKAGAARGVKDIDGEIDRLDRLLSEVIRDHIEAAEEGWPDADSKYADLESQIRDAIKTAEALRRKFNRP